MHDWDAVETAARIRARDVSPREVVEAAIRRAEAAAPLDAIVTETFGRALERAEHACGPFAGVPFFVKDLANVAGVRIAWGTRAVGNVVSKRSDESVTTLDALGFVSLGKSATPELGLAPTTEPLARRPTRNPWDIKRSAGGSSGGAAALVAAGVVPIAHASDGGGSIRIPASASGLVGLKVTRSRFDMEGSALLPVNVAVHGVLTRSVRDTIAFWTALESVRRRTRAIGPVRDEPTRPLRIAVFVDSPSGRAVSPEVTEVVEATARACAALGHHVEPISSPFTPRDVDDFLQLWCFVAWAQLRAARVVIDRNFDVRQIEPWTRELAHRCRAAPRATWRAIRRMRAFHTRYADAFAAHDVLLSPVTAAPPTVIGHLSPGLPFEVLVERIVEHCPFTGLVNAAGAPAISLPMGRTRTGLPIGVQLAARRWDERPLLSLAAQLERARPWPTVATAWRDAAPGR